MKTEFIPYEQALALKELGFSISCYERYHNEELEVDYGNWNGHCIDHIVSAPLYQQAFRWFRERYNLFSSETYLRGINNGKLPVTHSYSFRIFNIDNFEDFYGDEYNTYEEAELECLKKLIEIVREQKI
jgi:hypothetical protein